MRERDNVRLRIKGDVEKRKTIKEENGGKQKKRNKIR